jgi:AAA+ superfamily predicted ATPase
MSFKIRNCIGPGEIKRLICDVKAGSDIELLKPKKILFNNRKAPQIDLGKEHGLVLSSSGKNYRFSIIIFVDGEVYENKEAVSNFLNYLEKSYDKLWRSTVSMSFKSQHYGIDYGYAIRFFINRSKFDGSMNTFPPDFSSMEISSNGNRNIKSSGIQNITQISTDVENLIQLIERLIQSFFEVYKINTRRELCTSYKIITPLSHHNNNGSKNYSNSGYNRPFMESLSSNMDKIYSNTIWPTRTLRDPPEIANEKKYDDKSRLGNWERVKNTYVTDLPKMTFEDIGGYDEVKRELLFILKGFQKTSALKRYGIRRPKGIILHGLPGTGKTMFVKALAYMARIPLFLVTVADISSKWIGEQEVMVDMLLALARANAPCIMLFDEIDSIMPDRSNVREWYQRIVSVFLQGMDGFNSSEDVLFVGTTNYLENVDKAFLRPGRFDIIINIPKPNVLTREEIFRIHCTGKYIQEVDCSLLASNSDGLTGADIESVVQGALKTKMMDTLIEDKQPESIQTNDILNAINEFKRSRGKVAPGEILQFYT